MSLKNHVCRALITACLACLAAAGCSRHEPVRSIPEVDAEAAQVQVYPLQNPAVRVLRERSTEQREAGDLRGALDSNAAALELAPENPLLMQDRAELHLLDGDYREALRLAQKSWQLGPRVGPLCERNWNTIALAAPRVGNDEAALEARRRVTDCSLPPVPHVDDQVP